MVLDSKNTYVKRSFVGVVRCIILDPTFNLAINSQDEFFRWLSLKGFMRFVMKSFSSQEK